MVESASSSSSSSVYAVLASWFTPSLLFIFINLVIGIIALTSRFANTHHRKHHQRGDSPGQLARSPSLFDRVMSFNLGYYQYQPSEEPESVSDNPDKNQTRDSPPLERVSSLLDRVRSIEFRVSRSEEKEDPKSVDPTREEMTRTPSLLDRIKSMKFYRSVSRKEEKDEPEPEERPKHEKSGTGSGQEEEEEVDKKADDFINRFKQQLRMQRLDSILRYRDMLKSKAN